MKKALRLAFLSSAVIGFLTACGGGNSTTTTTTTTPDSTAHTATTTGITKDFTLDSAASVINWKGSKTGGEHHGTIHIKSGTVKVTNGKVSGGSFVINMNSITVNDLKGKEKSDLETHLKTKDFFEADKYAEGKFEITGVNGNTITGNLTMKDKTNPVSFTAEVTADEHGFSATTPEFKINRQEWGVNYASKMKDVVISDDMVLQINLKAK